MQGLEEDELEGGDLKMPSDLEADEEDYDDEDERLDKMLDEYGQEMDDEDDQDEGEEVEGDGESELNDIFEQANDNKEMDLIESLR